MMKGRMLGVIMMSVMLAGCATIVNGHHQDYHVASEPSGSQVSINGMPRGVTPVMAFLRRGETHVVKVEREGYRPYETTVRPVLSTWLFGNLVSGGPIGLAINLISGGGYEHSADRVHVIFPPVAQGQEGSPPPIVRRSDDEGERRLHRPCGRSC